MVLASTHARLLNPTRRGSSMGLRFVLFDSQLRRRVLVVCVFCTGEPSRSHPAPCGLFSRIAHRPCHASTMVRMTAEFFRYLHESLLRMANVPNLVSGGGAVFSSLAGWGINEVCSRGGSSERRTSAVL